MKRNKFIAFLLVFVLSFSVCGFGSAFCLQAAEGSAISYEASLKVKDVSRYTAVWMSNADYRMENLNDGDLTTIVQPVYKSLTGEDVYQTKGVLKDSFYIILEFESVYDLTSIAVCWFPGGGRAYKYNVEVSTDYNTWTKVADHSANVDTKDTITDTLNAQARFLRLEILGNYRSSDNSHSNFFPTSEITVKGTPAASQPSVEPNVPREIEYDVELTDDYGEAGWTNKFPAEHLNDGDLSTCAQIEYSSVFDESTGLCDEPFYLKIDLFAVYDLSEIQLAWIQKGDKYYMYNVYAAIYEDDYTLCVNRTANRQPGTVTDSLENVSARYLLVEVLGNYMPTDATGNSYYAINELSVTGVLSKNQPTATPTMEAIPTATVAPSTVPPTATPQETTAALPTMSADNNGGNAVMTIVFVILAICVVGGVVLALLVIKKKKCK